MNVACIVDFEIMYLVYIHLQDLWLRIYIFKYHLYFTSDEICGSHPEQQRHGRSLQGVCQPGWSNPADGCAWPAEPAHRFPLESSLSICCQRLQIGPGMYVY